MSFHLTCSVPLKAITRLRTTVFQSNHTYIEEGAQRKQHFFDVARRHLHIQSQGHALP